MPQKGQITSKNPLWSEVTSKTQNFTSDPQEVECSERIVITVEVHGIYRMPYEQIRKAAKQAINRHFKTGRDESVHASKQISNNQYF